ncbi:hypothetical protein RIF29_23494 [Crotalaria pallida]|uniref:Uncharacterized protein n=1 Tax=Crotalaria pallida TaxID=3830 RepID=A0AAN9F7U7_CROPI
MNRLRSSMLEEEEEEEVAERTLTFYLWHPCFFLKKALTAFLRCLGVDKRKGSMKKKEEKSSLLNQASDTDLNHVTGQKSYQEAADPPSTTAPIIINTSELERRGGARKPPLSQGPPPQHG